MPNEQGGTLLDVNFDEVPDFKTLEDGEYQLEITEVEHRKKDNGSEFLLFRFEAFQHEDADQITDVFMLDHPDYNDRDRKRRLASIRDFAQMFGIEAGASGLDTREFVGERVWAVLEQTEDPEYGESNEVVTYNSSIQ